MFLEDPQFLSKHGLSWPSTITMDTDHGGHSPPAIEIIKFFPNKMTTRGSHLPQTCFPTNTCFNCICCLHRQLVLIVVKLTLIQTKSIPRTMDGKSATGANRIRIPDDGRKSKLDAVSF